MATIISIALQKGGVGKSTTAQALASTFGYKGKKVLLIDMDGQHNVTYASGVDEPELSITDVLNMDCTAKEALISCKYYDLLAADDYLSSLDAQNIKPSRLKNTLLMVEDNYDLIIIDTPPALGSLSYCSLVASNYVVVPCEPGIYGLQGLSALHKTIKHIQDNHNPHLAVLGILLVKYHTRTLLNRDIRQMLEDYSVQMNTTVFKSTIREGVAVREAQAMREPLIDYARKSNPNVDYMNLADEIGERIGMY